MEEKKNHSIVWKVSTVVVSCALATVSTCYAMGVGWKQSVPNDKPALSQSAENTLSLWTDEAQAKQKLVSYIKDITDYLQERANRRRLTTAWNCCAV